MKTVADELNDQWHKMAAIIMKKLGHEEIEITVEDVNALEGWDILLHAKSEVLTVSLVKSGGPVGK